MPDQKPINAPLPDQEKDEISKWFGHFIDHLKVDRFLLCSDVASLETKNFYNDIIFGDETSVVSKMRETSSVYFIGNIIKDYLKELKAYQRVPIKLALAISDSKILVWSEIEDNDERTEDALLLSEAKVNGKYHKHGFYLTSTIIEKSDGLSIPPHYQPIIE